MARQRPLGVTILGILAIIGGILGIFGSFAVIFVGAVVSTGSVATNNNVASGGFITLLGIILLATSVGDIVVGIGFLGLKPWAWTLGIALMAIGILIDILFVTQGQSVGSEVVSILISAAILYYLFTPNVKAAFGRA